MSYLYYAPFIFGILLILVDHNGVMPDMTSMSDEDGLKVLEEHEILDANVKDRKTNPVIIDSNLSVHIDDEKIYALPDKIRGFNIALEKINHILYPLFPEFHIRCV